jgi:flagellar motor switch protein FliM
VSGEGILSADKIAELFDSAGRGEAPAEGQRRGGARRGVRVRPVDFSRPTKFTAEQERRVTRSMEAFCRSASTRLSAELRAALDLEVINTSQLNWSHAHAQLPGDAICTMLEARPAGTTLLLSTERGFVLQAIDLLLGGTVDVAPRERRLTEIDWALTTHVLKLIVAQLSVIWHDVAGVELAVNGLESQMETAQVAAVSEPTLALTIEARLGRGSSTMVLLIPHVAVESFIDAFSGEEGRHREGGGGDDLMRGAVARVDVTLRAEVASVELTAEELLALQPGDLLRLDGRADHGVTVFADDVPVCRARPGRSGRRRAIQVLDAESRP